MYKHLIYSIDTCFILIIISALEYWEKKINQQNKLENCNKIMVPLFISMIEYPNFLDYLNIHIYDCVGKYFCFRIE